MEYIIFYTGLASTPFTVGLKCETTNEVIHEINVSRPTGRATRERYEKMKGILENKYNHLTLN
jgi:hypothetical protein